MGTGLLSCEGEIACIIYCVSLTAIKSAGEEYCNRYKLHSLIDSFTGPAG